MLKPEPDHRKILVPFDRREGISLSEAAAVAGKSISTLRNWCVSHGLGRRVGDGTWVVSRIALQMFLDGNSDALADYHSGNRCSKSVTDYYKNAGMLR